MANDTHMKLDGVEGESQHQDHKNEIAVLSWSWGVSNDSDTSGGGSGKGKADPHQFTFLHGYDKASPVLSKKCAQGVHFPTAVLTARKPGEGQKDFLVVTMKEVYITSVQPTGSSSGDITEAVTMSYGSIDFSYKAQDATGKTGGEVKFGWEVKTTKIT